MIAISKRLTIAALAVMATSIGALEAVACCGNAAPAYYPSTYSAGYAGSYNTYYAGSYNAYYPATYQTNSSGWYPGYYLNQVRARMWGSPNRYVAAYPTTTYYSAGYAPAYSASYAPAYASYAAPACSSCSSGTCQSCTAGYAPSGFSTCGVQQVSMRPVCTTACSSPCSTCTSGCAASAPQVVTQASYEQPTCSTCAANNSVVQVQGSAPAEHTPDVATPQTFDPSTTSGAAAAEKPAVPADSNVPMQREEQKPPVNGTEVQPAPGEDTTGAGDDAEEKPFDPYDPKNNSGSDSSTFFEAPKLHDPNDRTASRGIPAVKTVVYKQPASYRTAPTQRVTAEQVRQDAIGWSSAGN